MDIRRHLKQARTRTKKPFARTAFTVVSALVREYGLDHGFLAQLRDFSLPGAAELLALGLVEKDSFEAPLFSLTGAPGYWLTQEILAAADNPYLRFAHSPEELLLSGPLFRLNPELAPAALARVHFRTLAAREIIQREISRLESAGEAEANPELAAAWGSLLHRLNAIINNKQQEHL